MGACLEPVPSRDWTGWGFAPCACVHGSAALRCCGRPAGTVCSGAAGQLVWPGCPSGAPVLGGNAARSGGRHERTADSGKAAPAGASGAGAAAELGSVGSDGRRHGKGRSGGAVGACLGASRGGRYGGSSGHTRCRCRASDLHERIGARAARRFRCSALRSPSNRSGDRRREHTRVAAAPNCSGSSCRIRYTHKACLLPLLTQRAC